MNLRASTALALLLTLMPAATEAQNRALTLDDLYNPSTLINFSGRPISGLAWLNDTHYIWPRPAPGGVDWVKVDASTGAMEPLFDAKQMERALTKLASIPPGEAEQLSRSRDLVFNADKSAVLLTVNDDLYYYTFVANRSTRLTSQPGEEEVPSFSPDGKRVGFVRDGNLFVVDIDPVRERALTTDGGPELRNGRLDWVYEEELYGRGNTSGYWWSPDSSTLAFLQLDQRPVPEFTVIDHLPYRLGIETWDYPKAGDPNPLVKLGLAAASGGQVRWVDTSKYGATDLLVVNVGWKPDSRSVVYQVQDREQSWLDLNTADRTTGESRTLFRETSKAWVNCGNVGCQDDDGNPIWLKNGAFLWFSERTGWRHLYLHHDNGTAVRPVTTGTWEVRTVHGVDEQNGWIYFSGTERSYIGRDVYRIKLDGTGLKRLSTAEGTHTANFSPGFSFYLDRWSDVHTPPQTRMHHADGRELRLIDANRVTALNEFRHSKPEFLQVKTRDGFVMEAMLIMPPDFRPVRKYHVLQSVFGGAHSQGVRFAWTSENMFFQLLAESGIIVWLCDNRSASGKGAESTWPVFKRLGESELRDIEDGLTWLKQQPYIDGTRIGINGWSYGGFLTSYALTHSKSFVMGIAGGTVSDWRDYDTIYTERFLQTPQKNPEGYRESSPRFFADKLHGRLMLLHGTIDDNVHVQNTIQFAYELQRAGKPFELMLYPRSRHAVTDPYLVLHMRRMMLAFIL
ncbi:MAG: S9 family peptidase [Vicinamibacterales bacterium]